MLVFVIFYLLLVCVSSAALGLVIRRILAALLISNILLFQERGFLSLSAALLSSSVLRSEVGDAMDVHLDIASSIGAIILSLLFCRSGLLMAAFIFSFLYIGL